jgi:putative inorganic carbon (HCO3(-)) transporter
MARAPWPAVAPALRGVSPDALYAVAVAAPLGVALVGFSHLTPAWLILLLCALVTGVAILWSGNIKMALLGAVALTFPVEITKALILSGGVYAPALTVIVGDVFLIPLLALWLWERKVVQRAPLARSPFLGPALCLLIWTWITPFYSPQLVGGLCAAILHTKFFLMFLCLTDCVDTARRLRAVLVGVGGGLVLNLMYTAAQFLTGSRLGFQGSKTGTTGTSLVFAQGGGLHTLRPYGFLSHPNQLAAFLTFLLPALLALVLVGRRRLRPAVWTTLLVLLLGALAALALTLSRGGWLACAASFACVFAIGMRRRLVASSQLAFAGAAGVAVLVAAAAVYPALYLRLTDSDERATESRVLMIHQALLISQENPLFGVGLGGYNAVAQYRIPAVFSSINPEYQKDILKGIVHNKYLLVLSEMGVIGLVLFLYLLYRALRSFFEVRRWVDDVHHALGLGLASAIVAQLVFYHFDHFYIDLRVGMLWLTFGLLSALIRLQPRDGLRSP